MWNLALLAASLLTACHPAVEPEPQPQPQPEAGSPLVDAHRPGLHGARGALLRTSQVATRAATAKKTPVAEGNPHHGPSGGVDA